MPEQVSRAERWRYAICTDLDPNIFFPGAGRPSKNPPYKEICGNCLIQHFCLEYGIVHEEVGVWGGLTQSERDSISPILKESLIQKAKAEGWYEYRKTVDELLADLVEPQSDQNSPKTEPNHIEQQASQEFLFDFELVGASSSESEFRFDFEIVT